MGLLPGVASHVHQEHVLRLEWLLFPHASGPTADELFATLLIDVVTVYMLHELLKLLTLFVAVAPATDVVVWFFDTRVTVVDSFGFLGIGFVPGFSVHF